MSLTEARARLALPADKANNNCVQDARLRLREAIILAESTGRADAPSYVLKAIRDLDSWLGH